MYIYINQIITSTNSYTCPFIYNTILKKKNRNTQQICTTNAPTLSGIAASIDVSTTPTVIIAATPNPSSVKIHFWAASNPSNH